MEQLYESCGYLASFLGTLIEGEVFLLTSVISAKLGYFNFWGGMIAAFIGAFLRDMIQFILIKQQGVKLLRNKPKLQKKLDDASSWFDKKPTFYLVIYRLIYGLGTPIIMLAGLKENIDYKKFAFFSTIAIGIWITLVGGIGYFCAEVMIEQLNFISEHSTQVIAVLVVLGIAYWYFVKRPKDEHCFKIKDAES